VADVLADSVSIAPAKVPECRDCRPVRTFPGGELALAVHRRTSHGVALRPEMRRLLALQGSPNTPKLSATAEKVPASAVGLPWIRYPREVAACEAIVDRIDAVVRLSTSASDAELLFWASLRDVMAAIGTQARITTP
jgi:hypothetical protein